MAVLAMRKGARSPAQELARPLELVLASHAPLGPSDLDLIGAHLTDPQTHPLGSEIAVPAGEGARLVVSGWVGWVALLPDGRRQIVSIALPGEFLEGPGAPGLGMSSAAITSAATVDAAPLVEALADRPASSPLARAWRAVQEARRAGMVHHILRLGRLSAYERTASLLLDLHERQRRAGLADDASMPLPLTQEALADVLGLSLVHVNRVLQQLRREGLIVCRSGRVVFPDRDALAAAACAQVSPQPS